MTAADEPGFHAAIMGHDWLACSTYSDWLADHDRHEPEVFLWRWVGHWRRLPHHRLHYRRKGGGQTAVPARYGWGWYPEEMQLLVIDPKPPDEARLPVPVFRALRAGSHDHAYYDGFWAAMWSLQRALDRLRAVLVID